MVKSIKIEQHLLKNDQSHDSKNNRSEHLVSIYPVDVTSVVLNYKSLLITTSE